MTFLFRYRITPQSTTGQSLSKLLLGRRFRSHLDLLQLDLSSKVHQKQNYQKETYDYHVQECSFEVDDLVLAKNYRQGSPRLLGAIINKRSTTSFLVR